MLMYFTRVLVSSVITVFSCSVDLAIAQDKSDLVCDGPNHTPILYEDRDFKGQALHIFLEEYEPLYLSDEETFARKASSICVQFGYVVSLYDKDGNGVDIEGPAQLNLETLDFDDRAYAGMAIRVEAMTIPEGPADKPQLSLDYSDYELITGRIDEALASEDCALVTETYDFLGQNIRARGSVPQTVMFELGLGRPTVGAFVRKNMHRIRQQKSNVCNTLPTGRAPGSPGQANANQQLHLIDRHYAVAMQSENCELVNDMAARIGANLEPKNVPYAMRKILSLSKDRAACFEQTN